MSHLTNTTLLYWGLYSFVYLPDPDMSALWLILIYATNFSQIDFLGFESWLKIICPTPKTSVIVICFCCYSPSKTLGNYPNWSIPVSMDNTQIWLFIYIFIYFSKLDLPSFTQGRQIPFCLNFFSFHHHIYKHVHMNMMYNRKWNQLDILCTIVHYHQQCTRVPSFHCPHQHLLFSVITLFIIAILMNIKGLLNFFLISVALWIQVVCGCMDKLYSSDVYDFSALIT